MIHRIVLIHALCLSFLVMASVCCGKVTEAEFARRLAALEDKFVVEVTELRTRLQIQEDKLDSQVKLTQIQEHIIHRQQERITDMGNIIMDLSAKLERGNDPKSNDRSSETQLTEPISSHIRDSVVDESTPNDKLARQILLPISTGQQQTFGRNRRQIFQETRVAFSAGIAQHSSILGEHQIIPFEKVFVLVDSTHSPSTYSTSTGVFTAPVAGVYVFSVTILGDRGFYGHFYIYKNDHSQSILFVDGVTGGSRYDKMSQTLILVLERGDSVSIRNGENGHSIYGSNHSLFCGFLLYEYEAATGVVG